MNFVYTGQPNVTGMPFGSTGTEVAVGGRLRRGRRVGRQRLRRRRQRDRGEQDRQQAPAQHGAHPLRARRCAGAASSMVSIEPPSRAIFSIVVRRAGMLVVGLVLLFCGTARAGTYEVWSCADAAGKPAPTDGWAKLDLGRPRAGPSWTSARPGSGTPGPSTPTGAPPRTGIYVGFNGRTISNAAAAGVDRQDAGRHDARELPHVALAGQHPGERQHHARADRGQCRVGRLRRQRAVPVAPPGCVGLGTDQTPFADANLLRFDAIPAGKTEVTVLLRCDSAGANCAATAGGPQLAARVFRMAAVLRDDSAPTFLSPPERHAERRRCARGHAVDLVLGRGQGRRRPVGRPRGRRQRGGPAGVLRAALRPASCRASSPTAARCRVDTADARRRRAQRARARLPTRAGNVAGVRARSRSPPRTRPTSCAPGAAPGLRGRLRPRQGHDRAGRQAEPCAGRSAGCRRVRRCWSAARSIVRARRRSWAARR